MSTTTPNRARAIESFRIYLAVLGYDVSLLTDDEAWKWLEHLVEDMDRYVEARRILNSTAQIMAAAKAEALGRQLK